MALLLPPHLLHHVRSFSVQSPEMVKSHSSSFLPLTLYLPYPAHSFNKLLVRPKMYHARSLGMRDKEKPAPQGLTSVCLFHCIVPRAQSWHTAGASEMFAELMTNVG